MNVEEAAFLLQQKLGMMKARDAHVDKNRHEAPGVVATWTRNGLGRSVSVTVDGSIGFAAWWDDEANLVRHWMHGDEWGGNADALMRAVERADGLWLENLTLSSGLTPWPQT